MLAILKAAVLTAFSRFINKKRAIKQLDWIVINKYYIMLDSDNK